MSAYLYPDSVTRKMYGSVGRKLQYHRKMQEQMLRKQELSNQVMYPIILPWHKRIIKWCKGVVQWIIN